MLLGTPAPRVIYLNLKHAYTIFKVGPCLFLGFIFCQNSEETKIQKKEGEISEIGCIWSLCFV